MRALPAVPAHSSRPAAAGRGPASAPRVLFVCPPGSPESSLQRDALRRAHALARAFGGELFVLRVLPDSTRHDVLMPHLSLMRAMSDLSRARHTLEETHAQCEAQAPGLPIDQVLIRHGARLHEAYRAASELRAALIVMPRQRGVSGRDVAWLATMAGAPVLVARPATRGDAVVAATDMRDPGYPVLRQAAEWCQRLESTLVCVHNTGGSPASSSPGARSAIDLLQAALTFGRDAEGIVARRADPVEAILGEARAREADLVVVGVRPRTWLDVFSSRCVASRLVDRARRSVLVTPIRAVA